MFLCVCMVCLSGFYLGSSYLFVLFKMFIINCETLCNDLVIEFKYMYSSIKKKKSRVGVRCGGYFSRARGVCCVL